MGGYGSGRPTYKQKAESCRSLDVNQMHRAEGLKEGWKGFWVWSRDGEEVGRIGCRAEQGRLFLDYRVKQYGGDWKPITQHVPLTYAGCNYGGQRPYFRCPGVVNGQHCGRRVAKLFSGGQYFLCRHCYSVAYTSQSEDRHSRLLRRANKIRMALGGEPGTVHFIAWKPKGMWQRTYQRKRFEIEWCEDQANIAFIRKYAHFFEASGFESFLA
ncbi:MAG: hypothetical protein JKY94_11585 [Rhodobacteraceae bacterium]|nr:hypothetical protein [Paracoccaceae bacterium]